MRLEYCQYHCASCFTSFPDVDAEENLFPGQFLLRSPKGALAFLDIYANHVFDGVNHMVRAHPRMNSREIDTASVFFHNWYGRIAVDPDDDGENFSVGANPACPHCGGTRTYFLAGSRTGRYAEKSCPPAGYIVWIRSGEEEKRKRIEDALGACNYLMTPFSRISLRQAQYRCRNSHVFSVAGDFRGPFAYGEWLMRSAGDTLAFSGLEDKSYYEVESILDEYRWFIAESRREDFFRMIYGRIACDPDPAGNFFYTGDNPRCPVCGGRNADFLDFLPPTFTGLIPSVTHLEWDSLGPGQKSKRIVNEIARWNGRAGFPVWMAAHFFRVLKKGARGWPFP